MKRQYKSNKDFLLYNTITKQKEIFKPLHPPQVKMYCCGPTVYDLLHIGNFRGAVFFNFLRHWLEYKGYKVTYAYNFTDVDDKILNRAKKENKQMKEIADKYIAEFKKDFQALKLKEHDHNPQATQFIQQMIELIDTLLQNKKAYTVDKDVYYSVKNFPNYGKLSKRKTDELISGARVEVDERKKNPADFALWKSCPDDESGWDSPWGRGRPGWHLECTTMIFSLLGNNIDIHGGGSDLIFPHHENELAQAEGAKEGPFVKYWVHNNMFTFGGEKMAKSTGNVNIMRDFLTEYNGEIFKYLVLSSHYRSMTEVSENKILQCIQALSRIYTFLKTAKETTIQNKVSNNDQSSTFIKEIQSAEQNIEEELSDDLNTPAAFAVIFNLIRQFNEINQSKRDIGEAATHAKWISDIIMKYGKLMSLFQESPEEFLNKLDDIFLKKNNLKKEDISQLVSARTEARKNKDFKKADEIRQQLLDMGIEVKDSPSGTTWSALRQ